MGLAPYWWEGGAAQLCALCRKKLCAELQKTFTNPGQPGEMFSGVFRALADKLMQPESERSGATKFFQDGHRHILPSFFELLIHLQVCCTPCVLATWPPGHHNRWPRGSAACSCLHHAWATRVATYSAFSSSQLIRD